MKTHLKGARCEGPVSNQQRATSPWTARTHVSSAKIRVRQADARQTKGEAYLTHRTRFSNYYQKAENKEGVTGNELLKMLEKRFDNVIYRAGIASSRKQCQLISHGLCKLNSRIVDIPSVQIRVGDKFEIKDNKKEVNILKDALSKKSTAPRWIKVDLKNLSGEMVAEPEKDDF